MFDRIGKLLTGYAIAVVLSAALAFAVGYLLYRLL